MKIIDYNPVFKDEIARLEIMQWGEGSDSDGIAENIEKYNVKFLEEDNIIYGGAVWHFTEEKNCFIDFIILKPEVQHKGYGSKLMSIILKSAIRNKSKLIECEAIDVKGKINAKNLLKKFEFQEKYKKENYWGEKYPDFHCRECNSCPCECTMIKYEKDLSK